MGDGSGHGSVGNLDDVTPDSNLWVTMQLAAPVPHGITKLYARVVTDGGTAIISYPIDVQFGQRFFRFGFPQSSLPASQYGVDFLGKIPDQEGLVVLD